MHTYAPAPNFDSVWSERYSIFVSPFYDFNINRARFGLLTIWKQQLALCSRIKTTNKLFFHRRESSEKKNIENVPPLSLQVYFIDKSRRHDRAPD